MTLTDLNIFFTAEIRDIESWKDLHNRNSRLKGLYSRRIRCYLRPNNVFLAKIKQCVKKRRKIACFAHNQCENKTKCVTYFEFLYYHILIFKHNNCISTTYFCLLLIFHILQWTLSSSNFSFQAKQRYCRWCPKAKMNHRRLTTIHLGIQTTNL